jgi:hypothetical protein
LAQLLPSMVLDHSGLGREAPDAPVLQMQHERNHSGGVLAFTLVEERVDASVSGY